MKWEQFFTKFADAFKIPETLDEATEYINQNPGIQTFIEEMSFRQVVINILVAANIITEKDFNKSVEHFKKVFTKQYAQELLSKIEEFKESYDSDEDLSDLFDDLDEEDDTDDPDTPPHYDA